MGNFEGSSYTIVAIQAALRAGALLRKGFGTSYGISSKAGKQNLVTEYDYASEKCIIGLIQEQFPGHAILAEESGGSPSAGGVLWVIDPLDGTVNFARNIPLFTISIGVVVDRKVISGVVYQPMTEELFVAERGKGAYLNGERLHVSKTDTFEKAILATGFPYNVDENPLHCIDTFANMIKQGIPIRRLGSAALDLSYVAAGRFDAYWEVSLHPWDIAAGTLLVEEAGGRVSHYDGTPHEIFCTGTMLASNGLLHEWMIGQIL